MEKKLDLDLLKLEFLKICRDNIHREGLEELLDWLQAEDFFHAPSSSRFHGAYPGGLCEHSIDVYRMAVQTNEAFHLGLSLESLTIASLFHDLCKVDFYEEGFRPQKINGVWEDVRTYTIKEQFVFGGHGAKSVYLVQQFMRLKNDEAAAINCHMGAFPGGDAVRDVSAAYHAFPLAWVTHVADEASVYLLER